MVDNCVPLQEPDDQEEVHLRWTPELAQMRIDKAFRDIPSLDEVHLSLNNKKKREKVRIEINKKRKVNKIKTNK